MKLKETLINLFGFFECSIENNTIIGSGIEHTINDNNNSPIADVFLVDVFDRNKKKFIERIAIVFNQVGDKLVFLYKKDKFDVTLISENLITFSNKDGIEHYIKRIDSIL